MFHAFQKKYAESRSYSLEGAAVFPSEQRGLLLIGSSGTGKSSTALQLKANFGWDIGGDEHILLKYDENSLNFLGGNTSSAVNLDYLRTLIGEKVEDFVFDSHHSKQHKKYVDLDTIKEKRNLERIIFLGIADSLHTRELTRDHAVNKLFSSFSEHIALSSYTWLRTRSPLAINDTPEFQQERLEDAICLVESGKIPLIEAKASVEQLPRLIKDLSN